MKRVLWYFSDHYGCGTYRVYIPAYGLESTNEYTSDLIFHRDVIEYRPEEIAEYDCVVFQRCLGTIFLDIMKLFKSRGTRILFEMDDNLFKVPVHNPASAVYRSKAVISLLHQQIAQVDGLIVSTQPLKNQIQLLFPDKPVFVCHNHLNEVVWGDQVIPTGQEMNDNKGKIVIGWQGSATHEKDFEFMVPALKSILERNPNVILRLIGNVPLCVQRAVPANRFEWAKGVKFEQYPALMRFSNFDIGLAPVIDSHFNQAKSNIKYLEYAALKVACVASKVYPYEKTITHGENGLIATNTESWIECLQRLIDDEVLRKTIAQRAYDHCWENWSTKTRLESWKKAIHGRFYHPKL